MATYRFNTKLIKKFVDAQKERIAEVASNIAPTIYDTNKTVEVMDTMQVISITNTTYNINKLGIKLNIQNPTYTEEEVLELLYEFHQAIVNNTVHNRVDKWFEQNKKK